MKNVSSSKVSKTLSSKAGDSLKSKCTKGLEASKSKNVDSAYCASTPRGFAELHLQRLRKESDAIRSEARAMARLLGADEKAYALRSEFESLNAEVNTLSAFFKKSDDKVADPSAWEAMQIALKKRHQAELSSLKTAAKLAGCKGKLGVADSEDDTSYGSYASTPSTLTQCRDTEVDAGNVSDQSNNGSSSDNSKGSTNKSTATGDTHVSDEDSKSDEKGSDSGTSPMLNLRDAVDAPQEAAVPQPRWVPRLELAPQHQPSLDDLDPFHSVLNRRRTTTVGSDVSDSSSCRTFAPTPRLLEETPAFQHTEVQWTPRLFNGEDEHVHTPPHSDDDLVANPREDTINIFSTTPRFKEDAQDVFTVQETLDEAEFAMMHANRAFAAVQSRHRSTPRNGTPRNGTPRNGTPCTPSCSSPPFPESIPIEQPVVNLHIHNPAPNLLVRPPVEYPVPQNLASESASQLLLESPLDTVPNEAPLTARLPAQKPLDASELTPAPLTARGPRQKPLDASELTPAPLTARGPRQVDTTLQREIAEQYDHEWKNHTNAVLQRALQTLESYKDRTKASEMDSSILPTSTTPCSPRNPRTSAPLASPRMTISTRQGYPQSAPQQIVPVTHTNTHKLPDASPLRAVVRTPNSQPQASARMPLGSHSAPNISRQAQHVSHLQGRSASPAGVFAKPSVGVANMYSPAVTRHRPPPFSNSAVQNQRQWVYGR